jgi:hypothetical protein
MKLTNKDKGFLKTLRKLLDERHLAVESANDGLSRFRLRQNYGDHIERQFGMTRQGVRWRFNHVFNEIYVEALTAVLMVENEFGTELRRQAITIAKERIELWQEAKKRAQIQLPRRQDTAKAREKQDLESTRQSPS